MVRRHKGTNQKRKDSDMKEGTIETAVEMKKTIERFILSIPEERREKYDSLLSMKIDIVDFARIVDFCEVTVKGLGKCLNGNEDMVAFLRELNKGMLTLSEVCGSVSGTKQSELAGLGITKFNV